MDNRAIGVFDSGLGGLTVVKELMKQLPNESIVYFGDTARIPYGTRSPQMVAKYSAQCIRFLMRHNIKMIIIACNTVSSCCLDTLQNLFDLPIIGVISPGAKAAVKTTKNGRVGVIGTRGTINSGAYEKEINKLNKDINVISTACSLFVPIVEEGWFNTDVAYLTAKRYLDIMKKEDIDTLVLGCTHYPLLTDTITKVMGPNTILVNPAEGTAAQVKEILSNNDMLRDKFVGHAEYKYYVSDFGQKFKQIGSRFLNYDIEYAEKIDIEMY
ncbi:MAG: glutamate racemase [Xylanivirga thermophila]|jgi:glutamate racemase|uniref:glutamate racemase n=1 Tax=Xylanivirga thermophila TaxID=2496273 RepID=UPI00101C72E3|nr:glutamate racemase [Xylanivirga thermophila]